MTNNKVYLQRVEGGHILEVNFFFWELSYKKIYNETLKS